MVALAVVKTNGLHMGEVLQRPGRQVVESWPPENSTGHGRYAWFTLTEGGVARRAKNPLWRGC